MSNVHVEDYKYDENTNTLTLIFQGGSVWDYRPVDVDDYHNMLKAAFPADVIRGIIRNRNIVGVRRRVGTQ